MKGTAGRDGGSEFTLLIDPDHCAQTAAKREYARLAEEYLRGGEELDESEYEYRLDLHRDFLQGTDFVSLRAACEALLRGAGALCLTLSRDGEGKPVFALRAAGLPREG